MSSHNKIGSIDAITGEYVIVGLGVKGNKYKCPKCGKGVILADGGINARHYKHTKDSNCSYFNAGESDLHYDGKYKMKHLLLHNTVEIHHTCNICNEIEGFEIPKNDTNKVVIEYAFKHNGDQKYADVALLNKNNNLIAIVEIVNTHKTDEGTRPNPWFEVSATELCKIDITINECIITCLRHYTCDDCIELRRINEINRIERERIYELERPAREEKMRLDRIKREEIEETERIKREEIKEIERLERIKIDNETTLRRTKYENTIINMFKITDVILQYICNTCYKAFDFKTIPKSNDYTIDFEYYLSKSSIDKHNFLDFSKSICISHPDKLIEIFNFNVCINDFDFHKTLTNKLVDYKYYAFCKTCELKSITKHESVVLNLQQQMLFDMNKEKQQSIDRMLNKKPVSNFKINKNRLMPSKYVKK